MTTSNNSSRRILEALIDRRLAINNPKKYDRLRAAGTLKTWVQSQAQQAEAASLCGLMCAEDVGARDPNEIFPDRP
jgi:hypothetical protein